MRTFCYHGMTLLLFMHRDKHFLAMSSQSNQIGNYVYHALAVCFQSVQAASAPESPPAPPGLPDRPESVAEHDGGVPVRLRRLPLPAPRVRPGRGRQLLPARTSGMCYRVSFRGDTGPLGMTGW